MMTPGSNATIETMPASLDHVDRLIQEWREQRPDVDASPMEIVARLWRASRILERSVEELYARYGLNQSQFGVLAALRAPGRRTASRRRSSTARSSSRPAP